MVRFLTLSNLVDHNQLLVKQQKMRFFSILTSDPQMSTRHMSSLLSISRTSIRRIYKDLGFKPYIPRLIHELNEYNFDRRIEFCEIFLSLLESQPDLVNRVI
jgi:hypothetical protein